MIVKFKRVTPTAIVPTKGSAQAAGYDLYSDNTVTVRIRSGETEMFGTGIAMEIPEGYFGAIYPRSGLSSRQGLRLANCVGVIDSDYRGEILVPLHNDSGTAQRIEPGERIAQIVIQKHEAVKLIKADALTETERGSGGFGSTGTK